MATQLRCPVCASDRVYSLLNTLHCKRCGNIWKEEKDTRSSFDTRGSVDLLNNTVPLTKKTDTLEIRMEKRLNETLRKYHGKFSIQKITTNIGDIQMAMFRRHLKNCVRKGTLVEEKDKHGLIWYSRPD